MRLLVTDGMGFIGSRKILCDPEDKDIVNLDNLSYGSTPSNLRYVESRRYRFMKGALVSKLVEDADALVNFAAETHVNRSISNPRSFHEANTAGTLIHDTKDLR